MARRTQQLPSSAQAPVAVGDPIVEENLPLPWVHYSHYAEVLGFSETATSRPKVCSCSVVGLERVLRKKREIWGPSPQVDQLTPAFFRKIFVGSEPSYSVEEFDFAKGVCHRCQQRTPTVRYCHEMYGGKFKQYYGYYIELKRYELGLLPFDPPQFPEALPQEVRITERQYSAICDKANLLRAEQRNLIAMREAAHKSGEALPGQALDRELHERTYELDKEANKLRSKLNRFVENEVRKEFGFRKVGEGWVSETIMMEIIERLFPDDEIKRHFRPEWMEGLELDCFVPSKKMAFEYQGQQHYRAVKAWGGEKALKLQKARDQKKRSLCNRNNILLVEVRYDDPLTPSAISELIEISLSNQTGSAQ